jgi:hypothetical protein
MNQNAGVAVFQHPQRSIGALFHIADADPTFHRSATVAPPLPSKTRRLSVKLGIPPMKPLPFHYGKFCVLV